MNENNPMLLKIVWAAVSVLDIKDDINVNTSNAHQLITFNKKDCHPYLFMFSNPLWFQTSLFSILTKLLYNSGSNIAKIEVINALMKN
jgi:hypothetical protein